LAYVSYDHGSSAAPLRRLAASRLAWGRLGMIAFSLAVWVGLAFALHALF
jgi:hypothetical protein